MNNIPLARDLALKRTVHAPVDQKPIYAWRDVIAPTEITLPPIVLLCPHGEERFDMTEVADTLGKAFTNVCISQGEKEIFTDKNRAWVAQICRELAGNLEEMARKQNPLRLTLNALYELIEKTLVDNNAYMVAKSLLLNRSRKLSVSRESAAQSTVRVIRRNSQIVPWNDHKVEIAIRKTFLSLARDSAPAVAISKAVSDRVNATNQAFVRIEEVQDIVQEEIMKAGHFKVAEAYILFRAERAVARENGTDLVGSAPEKAILGQETLVVVKKPNGETVLWEGADLRKRIEFAMTGLDLCMTSDEIEFELRRAVYDQISQKDLDATIILNSKTLIERDADFAKFAGRIQLTYIYEEVLGWDIIRDGIAKLKESHQKAFRKYIEHGIAIKRLNPRLLEYDLARVAGALDPSSDLEFDFLGVQTLYDRYLIVDKVSKPTRRIETPQFFWMRVSMGLFLDEKGDRESKAVALYDLYKTRRFCSSTPTLFNSGTLHSQLSSCFPGDTPVVTSTGLKNIAEIEFGDRVLAQDGEFRRVLGTRAKANEKRLVELSLSAMIGGGSWIRPTEDHLLFAIPGADVACIRQRASGGQSACVDYRGRREQCFTVKSHYAAVCERVLEVDFMRHATWIPAGEIQKGDFVEMLFPKVERALVLRPADYIVGLPLLEKEGFLFEVHQDEKRYDRPTAKRQVKPIRAGVPLDESFLRLAGYFLSEGHCQGTDSVFFTFGRTEIDYITDTVELCERVFGLTPLLQKGSGECTCVVLHSKLATLFMLALFGTGFDKKKLPQCVMEAPVSVLEDLLVGVFRGDACAVHRTQLTLQLSNRDLILQLFQVALKIGILPIVQKPTMSPLGNVQPYTLTVTPSDAPKLAFRVGKGIDLFDFQGEDVKWKNRRFFIEGRAFYRVDSVEFSAFGGKVYDIQVEGNPSFSAAGVCAHNCYLYYVDDSIEGIFQRGIAENAYLSKWAGGLGGSWTAVRGTGAYIGGTNGESQGVIPFLKLHNDQLVAVNQGGKRRGSGCAYLECWHNDIFEFLELRKNTGDDRRRTHDMNTANWIPDLFMKRMEARGTWTLFRANEGSMDAFAPLRARTRPARATPPASLCANARAPRASHGPLGHARVVADGGVRGPQPVRVQRVRAADPRQHGRDAARHQLRGGDRQPGAYISMPAGLVFDAAGPAVTGVVGAALFAAGYTLMWAATTGRIPSTIPVLSAAAFVFSQGSAWLDTTSIASAVHNFPREPLRARPHEEPVRALRVHPDALLRVAVQAERAGLPALPRRAHRGRRGLRGRAHAPRARGRHARAHAPADALRVGGHGGRALHRGLHHGAHAAAGARRRGGRARLRVRPAAAARGARGAVRGAHRRGRRGRRRRERGVGGGAGADATAAKSAGPVFVFRGGGGGGGDAHKYADSAPLLVGEEEEYEDGAVPVPATRRLPTAPPRRSARAPRSGRACSRWTLRC